jgi:spore maturation protein CgeB
MGLTVKELKARLREWPVVAAINAAIKAQTMERDVLRTRRRYESELQRRGLAIGPEPLAHDALRRRLADRPDRLGWPKECGDLHIFLAFPLHNWDAVLPQALSAFGTVTPFEWRSLGFDESAPDWVKRRDEMNRALLAAYRAAAAHSPVDVVVGYVSGATVAPEVLAAMAADGAVVTNFCFDDKVHWPGSRVGGRYSSPAAIAHAVDLNLTNDPRGMIRYAAHGGLAMFHPEAADPELHRPLEVDFEYDVSFIGARYG